MFRRTIIVAILSLAFAASGYGEIGFSIRYHDKKIYRPGDPVELKLTIMNASFGGREDGVGVFLDDVPVRSFGFDVREISGRPADPSESFTSMLERTDSRYRIVHLAGGQELSLTVDLTDWFSIDDPGQYRITGWYFPHLRGGTSADAVSQPVVARETLDLTVLPDAGEDWRDALSDEVKRAIMANPLDAESTVSFILDARMENLHRKALLYLDLEAIYKSDPIRRRRWESFDIDGRAQELVSFERGLQNGRWEIPGLSEGLVRYTRISSHSFPDEAIVKVNAVFSPQGIPFDRDVWFFLHKPEGYWTVRRVDESVGAPQASRMVDPLAYGRTDLDPRGVVNELLTAAYRDDWELVFRYLDVENMVRQRPEYRDRWQTMSASEHAVAMRRYREDMIAGRMRNESERPPLQEIGTWSFVRVEYTEQVGAVVVENRTMVPTAGGDMDLLTRYNFRLENMSTAGAAPQWRVVDYDIVDGR